MQTAKYRFGRRSRLNSPPASPSIHEPDEIFTFNPAARQIQVENVPSHVKKLEIVSLFHSLIGEVQSFQEVTDMGLEITFADGECAAKALCMNGYTVGGVPLKVTLPTPSAYNPRYSSLDDRRNLYVLGLPFALTKSEFAKLFGQYGTVSHCVILATVDNSSRRRGFIVMSTHEEAKNAMSAMTRTQIKGHSIDVSWAVVQRSQGFLDGGDRAMVLDSRLHITHPIGPMLPDRGGRPSNLSVSPGPSVEIDPTFFMPSALPTLSLLVSNLPTLLFSQVQDLRPLFFPFGQIDKLEIVHISALGSMAVIVQYTTTTSAQEAKESLNGQLYGSFRIDARYIGSWGAQNSIGGSTRGPLAPAERRMTDPLPHSVDRILRTRCAGHVNTQAKIPLPMRDLAAVSTSLGSATLCNFVSSPQSNRTPFLAQRLSLPATSNKPYGSFPMLHNYSNIDWFDYRSELLAGGLMTKGFANCEASKLDTLYQSSAA